MLGIHENALKYSDQIRPLLSCSSSRSTTRMRTPGRRCLRCASRARPSRPSRWTGRSTSRAAMRVAPPSALSKCAMLTVQDQGGPRQCGKHFRPIAAAYHLDLALRGELVDTQIYISFKRGNHCRHFVTLHSTFNVDDLKKRASGSQRSGL